MWDALKKFKKRQHFYEKLHSHFSFCTNRCESNRISHTISFIRGEASLLTFYFINFIYQYELNLMKNFFNKLFVCPRFCSQSWLILNVFLHLINFQQIIFEWLEKLQKKVIMFPGEIVPSPFRLPLFIMEMCPFYQCQCGQPCVQFSFNSSTFIHYCLFVLANHMHIKNIDSASLRSVIRYTSHCNFHSKTVLFTLVSKKNSKNATKKTAKTILYIHF